MIELALVVVVGRADERAPEPGQREDRAPPAGRHDRAARAAAGPRRRSQVGAAAGADLRDSASSWSSSRAQPVGPHAGRVDDVVRRAPRTPRRRARRAAHAGAPPALLDAAPRPRRGSRTPRRSARPRQHRQHEPRVVGLAVVEEVAGASARARPARAAARRPPRRRSTRWRSGLQASPRGACAAPRSALDAHHVVEVQADPDEAVEARAAERGHDDRQRADEMRRERDHQLALEQRLADEARGRTAGGSAARRGRACSSGSTSPTRSPRARAARRCSRGSRRPARPPPP